MQTGGVTLSEIEALVIIGELYVRCRQLESDKEVLAENVQTLMGQIGELQDEINEYQMQLAKGTKKKGRK